MTTFNLKGCAQCPKKTGNFGDIFAQFPPKHRSAVSNRFTAVDRRQPGFERLLKRCFDCFAEWQIITENPGASRRASIGLGNALSVISLTPTRLRVV
jgi:hypothetical protein